MAPIDAPSHSTRPLRTGNSPLMTLTIVLFPAPFEPTSATR